MFFLVVFFGLRFLRERERDIYTTTKIHSLNDGKGAKMKKRLFLLPSRRSKEGKRVIGSKVTQKGGGLFLCSILLLIYSSFSRLFSFLFCGSVIKPHV